MKFAHILIGLQLYLLLCGCAVDDSLKQNVPEGEVLGTISDNVTESNKTMHTTPTADKTESSYVPYIIKKGDSLWKLARRSNTSLSEIYAVNGFNQYSTLKIGQEILLASKLSDDFFDINTSTIGMDREEWLSNVGGYASIAYADEIIVCYRAESKFFYFKDDKLIRIDEGTIREQNINLHIHK